MRSSALVRLLVLVLPLGAMVGALGVAGTASAMAHSKPTRVVVSPQSWQSVRGDQVRLVVRAGPEHEDLKAWLNGVSVGRRFKVRDGARQRILEASAVDGLRRGRNVLRVQSLAKRGGYRRATVHFEIRHRRPLGSAGVDRRIVVGSRVDLRGLLRLDKSDYGRKGLRWDVVKAPAASVLSAPKETARASAVQTGLGERHTLSPTFRPDVRGRYQVQMTAKSGNGKTVDIATIYAVPPNPLITLKTSVPATEKEPQPGIQVGGEVLRAPYMRIEGKQGSYSGTVGGVPYQALWQVLAYDRVTMALKWNRTYGFCYGNREYWCAVGANGNPTDLNLPQELAELGPESLVVLASHPSGGTAALAWGDPNEGGFVTYGLKGIGLPNETELGVGEELSAAKAGEMAAVGVPGLANGDAKYIIGGEQMGLNGYLTPDSNVPKHYFYVPSERQPFDTRSADSCNSEGCTVTQFIGETKFSGAVPPGQAGFLVTGLDRLTLAPVEHQIFATASGLNQGDGSVGAIETAAMASYVKSLAARDLMVFITSVHGPGQAQALMFTPGTPGATWQSLTAAIAAIGGTRERFNTAAITAGSDYTLVGYAGLEEGAGNEIDGAGARLRGALVPNAHSIYEPQGITSGEVAPPELLMKILLRPPQPSAWPLEGNAEAMEAIQWIGEHDEHHLLGRNVRASYWTQLTNPELAGTALKDVENSTLPGPSKEVTFSAKAFGEAKAHLITELGDVKQTRIYMKELSQPANKAGVIGWQEAGLISKELEERLKQLKEEGKAKAEYFEIAAELLEMLSLGAPEFKEIEKIAKFAAAAAIAAEVGQTIWEGNYTGASRAPGLEVQALELGKKLRIQAEAGEAAFARMGDVIVSDWSKLQEVGAYGGCNPLDGTCGAYEELSQNEAAEEIAAAATKRSFDRVIYERLVPVAFPIWNTGTTSNQEAKVPPREFECEDISYPFEGAPQLSYHRSLWEFDPVTQAKTWRDYLSVARSGRPYGWATEPMLNRMFEPVPVNNTNAEAGGLAIDPGDFMRQGLKINEYRSHWVCKRPTPEEEERDGLTYVPAKSAGG